MTGSVYIFGAFSISDLVCLTCYLEWNGNWFKGFTGTQIKVFCAVNFMRWLFGGRVFVHSSGGPHSSRP